MIQFGANGLKSYSFSVVSSHKQNKTVYLLPEDLLGGLEGVAAGVESSMFSFISLWMQMYSDTTAATATHTA